MNEAEPNEHIMNEAMPPFPRHFFGQPLVWVDEKDYVPPSIVGKTTPGKAFMFDNIKPGDKVQVWLPVTHVDGDNMFDNIKPGDKVQVWLPVTHVDGDNITLAELITTGRESIVGHKPKERTPDEEWAALTEHEKQMLIYRHYESMGR